jgi:DNA-binding response OmpR family regulator
MNPIHGRKPRILLLDDSATARAVLSAALTRRGYEVITARDLAELDAALDRMVPDLILVDVHLPEIVGTDVVPWLRETKRVDRPILLCSTRAAEELAQLAEECGADGWIRKNGRPDELAARVEHHLGGGEI